VHPNSISPSWARRIAWSLRHPMKSHQFPASNENAWLPQKNCDATACRNHRPVDVI